MSLAALIDAVKIENEAAAKLNARKLMPNQAPDIGRAYNGSLDAAKRLHDALLPGTPTKIVDMSQEHMGAHGWYVFVNWPHTEWRQHYTAPGPFSHVGRACSPARAWLLAILRAMEQNGTKTRKSESHE
jgi:hypothetical protein